jgi:hypothetical protein
MALERDGAALEAAVEASLDFRSSTTKLLLTFGILEIFQYPFERSGS